MCLKLVVLLDQLDGEGPDVAHVRQPSSERAKVSGDLLFAVHCADMVRAEILSQYHVYKGRSDVPLVTAA